MSRHSLSICQMPQDRYFVQFRNTKDTESWVARADEIARGRFKAKDDLIQTMAVSLGWFGRVYASVITDGGQKLNFRVDKPSSTEKAASLSGVLVSAKRSGGADSSQGIGAHGFLERHAIPITLGEHLWHLVLQIQTWVAEWRGAEEKSLGSCAFVNALFQEMEEVLTAEYDGPIPSSDMRCGEEVRGRVRPTAEKITTSAVLDMLAKFASENGKSQRDVNRIKEAARWTREVEKLREEGDASKVKNKSNALAKEMEKCVERLRVGEEALLPYGVYAAESGAKSGLVRVFKVVRTDDQDQKKQYTLDFGDQMGVSKLSATEDHLDQKAFFKPLVDAQLNDSYRFEETMGRLQDEQEDHSVLEQRMLLRQQEHALPEKQGHEREAALRFRNIFAHIPLQEEGQPFQVEQLFQVNPLKDSVITSVLSSISSRERLDIETASITEFYYTNQHRLRSSPEIRVILDKWVSTIASSMEKHKITSPQSLDTLEMIKARLERVQQEQRIGEGRLKTDVEERNVPLSYSDQITAPQEFRAMQRLASAVCGANALDQRADTPKGCPPHTLQLVSVKLQEWSNLHRVDAEFGQRHLLEAIDACNHYALKLEAMSKELADIGPKQDALTEQYRARFEQNINFLLGALKGLAPQDFLDPQCEGALQTIIGEIRGGQNVTPQMHHFFGEQVARLETLVQEKMMRLREELVDALYTGRVKLRGDLDTSRQALEARLAHLREEDRTYQARLGKLQEWGQKVDAEFRPKIQAFETKIAGVRRELEPSQRELADLQRQQEANGFQLREVEGRLATLNQKIKWLTQGYEVTDSTQAQPTGKNLRHQESDNEKAQQANQVEIDASQEQLAANGRTLQEEEGKLRQATENLQAATQKQREQETKLASARQELQQAEAAPKPQLEQDGGADKVEQKDPTEELQRKVDALSTALDALQGELQTLIAAKDQAQEAVAQKQREKRGLTDRDRQLQGEQQRLKQEGARIAQSIVTSQANLKRYKDECLRVVDQEDGLGRKGIELQRFIEAIDERIKLKETSIRKETEAIRALTAAQQAAQTEIQTYRSSVARDQQTVKAEIGRREQEVRQVVAVQQDWETLVTTLGRLDPARPFKQGTNELKYPKDSDKHADWENCKRLQGAICDVYKAFAISAPTPVSYQYCQHFSQNLRAANGLSPHLAAQDQDFERDFQGLWKQWQRELAQEQALPLWKGDQDAVCKTVTDSTQVYQGDVRTVNGFVATWEHKTQVLRQTRFPEYKKCLENFEQGLNGQLDALKRLYQRFGKGVAEASGDLQGKGLLEGQEQHDLTCVIDALNQAYVKYNLPPAGQERRDAPAAALVTQQAANELIRAGQDVIDQLRRTQQKKTQEAGGRYTPVYAESLASVAQKIEALTADPDATGIDLVWELNALFQKIPVEHLETTGSFWAHHQDFEGNIRKLQALLERCYPGELRDMPPLALLQKALVEAILFRMTGQLENLSDYREALYSPFLVFKADADQRQHHQLLRLFETLGREEKFDYGQSQGVQRARVAQPTLAAPLSLDEQAFEGAIKPSFAHDWARAELPQYHSSGNDLLDRYVEKYASDRAEIVDREEQQKPVGAFSSEQVYELMRTNGKASEYGLQQLLAQLVQPDFLKALNEDHEVRDQVMGVVFNRLFRRDHLVEYFCHDDHLESVMVSLDQGVAYACHKDRNYHHAAHTLLRLKASLMNFLRQKEGGYATSSRPQYSTDPIPLAKEFTLPKKWCPTAARGFSLCYLEACAETFQFGFNVSRELSGDELSPILDAWMDVKEEEEPLNIPPEVAQFFKGRVWPSWQSLLQDDQIGVLSTLLQKRGVDCISASEEDDRPLCTVDYPLYTFYDEARKPYCINVALGSIDVGEEPVRVLPQEAIEGFPFGEHCRFFEESAIEDHDNAFRFQAAVGGRLRTFLALVPEREDGEASSVHYSIEREGKYYSHISKEQIEYGEADGLSKDLLQMGVWVEDTDPEKALCLDQRASVLAELTLDPAENRIQRVERIDEEKGGLFLVNYEACPLYSKLKHLTPKENIKVWADNGGQVQRVDLLDPRIHFVRNLISGRLSAMDPDLTGFYIAEDQGIPQGNFVKDWKGYLLLENSEGRKKLLMRQSALVREKEWAKPKEGYYALETGVQRDRQEEAMRKERAVPPMIIVDLVRNPKGKGTILDSMNSQANCFLALASMLSDASVDAARYLRRLPRQFVSDEVADHEGAILGDLFAYKQEALARFHQEAPEREKTNKKPARDLTQSVKGHEIELPQVAAVKLIAVANALQMQGLEDGLGPLHLPERDEVIALLKIYHTAAMGRETYHRVHERCRLTEGEVYQIARHYQLTDELLPSHETLALEAPREEAAPREDLDGQALSALCGSLVNAPQTPQVSEMMSFYAGGALLTHFQSLYHQIDALDANDPADRLELEKIRGQLERLEDQDEDLRFAIVFLKTVLYAKLQGGTVARKEGVAIEVARRLFAMHQRIINQQYGAVKDEILPEGALGALYEDLLAGDKKVRTKIYQIDERIRALTIQRLEQATTFAAFKAEAARWQRDLEGALKSLEKEINTLLTQNGLYDPRIQEPTVQSAAPYVHYKGKASFTWEEVAAMMKDVNTERLAEISPKALRAMERLKVHTHHSFSSMKTKGKAGYCLLPEGILSPKHFLQARLLTKHDYTILIDLENLTQLNDSTDSSWNAYLVGLSGKLDSLDSDGLRGALAHLKRGLTPNNERGQVKGAISRALKELHFQVDESSEREVWTMPEQESLNESRLAMSQAIKEIQQLHQGDALKGFVLSSSSQRVSRKGARRSQREEKTFTWDAVAAIMAQARGDTTRLQEMSADARLAVQRLKVPQGYSLQEVLANQESFPLPEGVASPVAFVHERLISEHDYGVLFELENFKDYETTSISDQGDHFVFLGNRMGSIENASLRDQIQGGIDASLFEGDLGPLKGAVAAALAGVRIQVDPEAQPAPEAEEREARPAEHRPGHYEREILGRYLEAHQDLPGEGMVIDAMVPRPQEDALDFEAVLKEYLSYHEQTHIREEVDKIVDRGGIIQWAENPAHYKRPDFYPSLLRHIRSIQEIQARNEQSDLERVGLKERCTALEEKLGVSRELEVAPPLREVEGDPIREAETPILQEEEQLSREVSNWLPPPAPLSRTERFYRWIRRSQEEYEPVLHLIDRYRVQETIGRAEQRLTAQKVLVEGLQEKVHECANVLPQGDKDAQRERARRLTGEADTIDVESVWIMYAKGNLADLKKRNPCLTNQAVQEIEEMITRHHVEATKCQVMEKQMAALCKVEALNGTFQRLHSSELSALKCVGPLDTLHEILGRYIRALTGQPRNRDNLKRLEKEISGHLAEIEDGTKFPELEQGLKGHSQGYTLQALADDMRSYKEAIKECVTMGESKRYFDPSYDDWRTRAALAYEHTLGTLFRRPQIEEFVRRVGTPNIVSWLGTGFGKTFMAPGLAKMLATGENLMTILDTRDLIPTTAKTRPEESRRIYDQATHRFAFSRVQEYDEEAGTGESPKQTEQRLQREYYELLRCINDQGYIITSKEAIGSITLQLLSWQRIAQEARTDEFNERIELAQSIITLFKRRGTALADEIHQILDIIEALDYSEGDQESLSNYQEYYEACSTLLRVLYPDSATADGTTPQATPEAVALKIAENQQTKVPAQTVKGALVSLGARIVDQASRYDLAAVEEGKEDLTLSALHHLLDECRQHASFGGSDPIEAVKHFLVIDEAELGDDAPAQTHQAVEACTLRLSEPDQKRIGALREMLGSTVVKVVRKSVGEEICLNSDATHTKAPGLSVCPGDKGVAQPHKELDDLFQTIFIHYMYYQVEGIPPEGLQRVMTEWKDEIEADALDSGVPFEEYGQYHRIRQLFEPLGVDLNKENFDAPEVVKNIATRSKGHPSVLCRFLEMAVFPQLRVFPRKIGFDAMDVASSFALFGGYSGTIQTRRSFHSSIEGREDVAIDEVARRNFEEIYTNEANQEQYVLEDSLETVPISHQLQRAGVDLKGYRAIIDVGGIFRENLRDNSSIIAAATDILEQFPSDALDAVVVHNTEGDLSIVRRGSAKLEPFSPKMTPPEYGKRLTIYRQAQTTGTDIPQTVSAKALVTISEKTKWASYEQGVGRLRRNKEGQTYATIYRESFLQMLRDTGDEGKFWRRSDGGARIKVQEFTQHEENNEIKLRTYYAALSEMANILKCVLVDVLCTANWATYFKLFEGEFFTNTIKDVTALLMLKGPICPVRGLEHFRQTSVEKIQGLIRTLSSPPAGQTALPPQNGVIIEKLQGAIDKLEAYTIPHADDLPESVQGPVEGATRENEVSKQKEAETEKSKELMRQAEREVSSEAFTGRQDLLVEEPREGLVLEKPEHTFKGLCVWGTPGADMGTLVPMASCGAGLMPFANDRYLGQAFSFFSDVSVGADYLQWRGSNLDSSQPHLLSPGQISAQSVLEVSYVIDRKRHFHHVLLGVDGQYHAELLVREMDVVLQKRQVERTAEDLQRLEVVLGKKLLPAELDTLSLRIKTGGEYTAVCGALPRTKTGGESTPAAKHARLATLVQSKVLSGDDPDTFSREERVALRRAILRSVGQTEETLREQTGPLDPSGELQDQVRTLFKLYKRAVSMRKPGIDLGIILESHPVGGIFNCVIGELSGCK